MNDIFISYAHLDDESLDEDQKGWITKFHRVLQVKLSQLLGESPTIWRDQKLSGSDIYDDKIVNEFKNARQAGRAEAKKRAWEELKAEDAGKK